MVDVIMIFLGGGGGMIGEIISTCADFHVPYIHVSIYMFILSQRFYTREIFLIIFKFSTRSRISMVSGKCYAVFMPHHFCGGKHIDFPMCVHPAITLYVDQFVLRVTPNVLLLES